MLQKLGFNVRFKDNGVFVRLNSTLDRYTSLSRFLPPWFLRNATVVRDSPSFCIDFFFSLAEISDKIPYGGNPVWFVYNVVVIAQADSIFERVCAY